jgi:hypothetical protein
VAAGVTSNLDAARSGDRLTALTRLRDTLADQLDTADSAIHAQLAAQYRQTLLEIDELRPEEESSDAESIAAAVALRLAGADASDAA